MAAISGHLEMLQLLFEHGARPEAKAIGGERALLLAAFYGRNVIVGGRIEVMRALLREGPNGQAKDRKKRTPLQIFRDNKE